VDEQGRTFIWDAWNRLVEVKQGSTTLVEYQYDGLKRRIVEDDGTDEKDLYYSDQWQVLEERVDGDTVTQYVWSAVYVDAMILRDRDADANTGNGLEERIYVLHDANYNVTAIVDTSGEVLERYYYEAYGRAVYLDDAFALQPDGQSEHAWQHLHQGGRLDEATGDYHFRHRDLSPTLGRWISQDPIGFEAGDANLYRYVGNGPGNRMDPFGLHDIELCGSDLNTNCPYINRELRRVKSIVKETGEVNKFYAVDTCVTWMLACMDKKFEDIERNGPFRRITMTPIEFPLSGFQPAIIHAALEIKINGTEHVFYLDNGGLGGTDHIFFPKDLEGFPKYGKPQPFGTVKEFDGDINTMLILPPVIPGLTGPFVR
jgi:RHS repeat-associated protein